MKVTITAKKLTINQSFTDYATQKLSAKLDRFFPEEAEAKITLEERREPPCGECIADRRGNKMPVLCGGNSVEILNPDLLIMSYRSSALEPFDFAVLKFTDEKELKPILDMYQNNGKPSGPLTRGLYFRGAE